MYMYVKVIECDYKYLMYGFIGIFDFENVLFFCFFMLNLNYVNIIL